MAQETALPQRTQEASQGRVARIRQWLRRAVGSDGHERHTLALIGKSTLAALIAWYIAKQLMGAQSPAFAPFSAVLIMQVTVYQSLLQSLRYLGAVSLGVALQGLFGFLAGPGLVTFALVALAAMAIGRWRPLGSQGSQVATAAFFAFSTYATATTPGDKFSQLSQIILLVLVGCGVGAAVNLLVMPPMRYRSAESGIHTLAHALCDLIGDMYPALRNQHLEEERTRHWRHRASQLGPMVSQAQSAVRTAVESTYYNPRRLLQRHHGRVTFAGYRAVIDALERVTYQLASMVRSLDQWHDSKDGEAYGEFLRDYGDFLRTLAKISDLFSKIDEDRLHEQAPELCRAAEQAQEARTRLVEAAEENSLPVGDPSRPYGILLAEATRLMDECQYTCDVLQKSVDSQGSPCD
ncbi:aromatic acid exporter family protein [Streptomyces sp. WMMB 322]|uniref:FUSC family protein n=1 Tax=Streptomyces sp. WMMB 322 TaxID=1286821 RepID=UPI0006E3EBBB|nr:aromatic acid exporter family protein [Streptomyces sp. WMMB 322]SCK27013.1 Uncharacterized membrane protein YgaE, UPF0421/DUF939 family [Streptomyces sp. WMMB 322]